MDKFSATLLRPAPRQACSSHHQIVIWIYKLNQSTNSETSTSQVPQPTCSPSKSENLTRRQPARPSFDRQTRGRGSILRLPITTIFMVVMMTLVMMMMMWLPKWLRCLSKNLQLIFFLMTSAESHSGFWSYQSLVHRTCDTDWEFGE